MSVVYLLVPLALIVGGLFVAAFIWAARRGQFDDLETPALRMLFDDEATRSPERPSEPPEASSEQTAPRRSPSKQTYSKDDAQTPSSLPLGSRK